MLPAFPTSTPAWLPLRHNVSGSYAPMVVERSSSGERLFDIYTLLLKNRIIFVGTAIDAAVANTVVAQLLYLQQDDAEADIMMYVNSPGGAVDAGLAIYDAMQLIRPDVATTCIGVAASMGAVLLAGGARGKRCALPNSRILIHQASAQVNGDAADIEVQAREILRLNARLKELLAQDTGQSVDRISTDINRDFWMSASQAMAYGLIDSIVGETAGSAAVERADNAALAAILVDGRAGRSLQYAERL
jgi:ATP-dependent Clp protease, protease subunit